MKYEGPVNKTEYALKMDDVIFPVVSLQAALKIFNATKGEAGMEKLEIVKRQIVISAWSRHIEGEPIVRGPIG